VVLSIINSKEASLRKVDLSVRKCKLIPLIPSSAFRCFQLIISLLLVQRKGRLGVVMASMWMYAHINILTFVKLLQKLLSNLAKPGFILPFLVRH
jgi:hypothetical protein